MSEWQPIDWQCSCCTPARQIYMTQFRGRYYFYHEVEFSPASYKGVGSIGANEVSSIHGKRRGEQWQDKTRNQT